MHKRDIIQALQAMKEQSKSRKFVQSVELIINFRDLDSKKPESQIDVKVTLPHSTGKKGSVKSLLFAKDKPFIESAKAKVDRIIEEQQIEKLSKKDIGLIINEFDLLLAEGPVMLTVAKHLGQQLAPKGKMPKPVTPNVAALEQVISQMGSVTRVTNKKGKFVPLVQLVIGNEEMPEEELGQNAMTIIDAVVKSLPRKQQNIKSVFVKETMGPPMRVGAVIGEAGKK